MWSNANNASVDLCLIGFSLDHVVKIAAKSYSMFFHLLMLPVWPIGGVFLGCKFFCCLIGFQHLDLSYILSAIMRLAFSYDDLRGNSEDSSVN